MSIDNLNELAATRALNEKASQRNKMPIHDRRWDVFNTADFRIEGQQAKRVVTQLAVNRNDATRLRREEPRIRL